MNDAIIFLDMDGVLNNSNYAIQKGITYFYRSAAYLDRANVDQLIRIQKATNAKIVISSSWRRYMSLDEFIVMFASLKVYNVIGMTCPDYKFTRAEQINMYIKEHSIKNFVVLDDGLLGRSLPIDIPKIIKRRFIRTDFKVGLTKDDANEAIKILGGWYGNDVE